MGKVQSKTDFTDNVVELVCFALVGTLGFLSSFLISSSFAPVVDSSAAEISVVNEATGYYANITSSGSVNLSIASTPDGAYKVGKDTLSIDTNAKNGYKLYISTIDHSSDSPALPSGTPANGLINGSSSSTYLSPSTGTINTPVRLQTNTWGYTTSRSTSSQAPATYTDTDAAPTQADGGQAIWKAVPVYGNEDIFYTNTNPLNTGSPAISTNSVDVYYAANASTALPSGTYTNTVLYTAIVDAVNEDSKGVSLAPVYQEGYDQTQELTIATGLYPGFNLDNLGTIAVTIGNKACTNPTPSLTSIGSLNITCTTPAQSAVGVYNVTVSIPKYGKTYPESGQTLTYEYKPAVFYKICARHSTNDVFNVDGTTFIKLADGNCWTKNSQGTMNWEQANALNASGASNVCPAGTHVPSAQEFGTLLHYHGGSARTDRYGSPYGYVAYGASDIYSATGWQKATYWSSTEGPGTYTSTAWYYKVGDDWSYVGDYAGGGSGAYPKTGNAETLCVGGTTPEFYTITDMQQMNHDICASVPAPTSANMTNVITKSNWTTSSAGTPQTTLVDTRSGTAMKTYTIRKFADGKCWMAQNLRYAPTTATALSSGSSDITSALNYTIPALGTANSGPTDYNGDEVIENGTTCNVNTPAGNCNYGAYYDATYYSWHTATAGTGTASMTSGFATSSICPRNWRLPTGGDGNGTTAATTAGDATGLVHGDFKQLDIAFGGTGANGQGGGHANWVNNTYGFNAALLGLFGGAGAYYSGSLGLWWSSSVYNGDVAYNLYLNTSVMLPQDNHNKGDSSALRCVAR